LSGVAQGSNGVPLIRRPQCILQPVGDTWVCKDLFESHTYFYGTRLNKFRLGFSEPKASLNKYPPGRSSLVPVPLHQLENITFGITEKYEPAARDNRAKINHAIWFDAVPEQRFNGRFELRHVESQMLKSDSLFASVLVHCFGCIGRKKLQSKSAKLEHDKFIRFAGIECSRAFKTKMFRVKRLLRSNVTAIQGKVNLSG